MERGIVLNALSRSSASLGASRGLGGLTHENNLLRGLGVMRSSKRVNVNGKKKVLEVVAKGKKGMAGRMYKPRPPPSIPKGEDDNPRFLLFIRTKKVPRWYPLSIVTGGTTAKIMVAAKDTPIGKSIYESTMTRNIAGVIYKDEEEIRKIAIKQYPVLKAASEFQYGYKLINPENPNSALYATDVVKTLPDCRVLGRIRVRVDSVVLSPTSFGVVSKSDWDLRVAMSRLSCLTKSEFSVFAVVETLREGFQGGHKTFYSKQTEGFQVGQKTLYNKQTRFNLFEIPPQEELKPVVEKVKDFFGNALSGVKESFGSISSLNIEPEEDGAAPEKENKSKAKTTS